MEAGEAAGGADAAGGPAEPLGPCGGLGLEKPPLESRNCVGTRAPLPSMTRLCCAADCCCCGSGGGCEAAGWMRLLLGFHIVGRELNTPAEPEVELEVEALVPKPGGSCLLCGDWTGAALCSDGGGTSGMGSSGLERRSEGSSISSRVSDV
jgi:hypothetical protein